jgi:methionyl-tRNA formyltransferase
MISIIYFCSRDWSLDILLKINSYQHLFDVKLVVVHKNIEKEYLSCNFKYNFVILDKYADLVNYETFISKYNFDFILTFGWSGYLTKNLFLNHDCLILHPSLLPNYAGGTPIQHQILDGLVTGGVTILKATDKVDGGPILFQSILNLKGELKEIKHRISSLGFSGLMYIYHEYKQYGKIFYYDQDLINQKVLLRRTKDESEIKLSDFSNFEATYFYNLTRSLQGDYPPPFIKCKNNTILYINKVSV